ncbi:hypothetical protein T4B_11034 [Trichinella pseudospiralis]|uniref:Uncharacterized protein n=1 Tax=Trichinella pseudospiralis TaxID=6337 RepID=A0A0V1IBQ7_TRIPS|nr:hypothetical protein T4B_11034 [Trichinella pseudospiralis]
MLWQSMGAELMIKQFFVHLQMVFYSSNDGAKRFSYLLRDFVRCPLMAAVNECALLSPIAPVIGLKFAGLFDKPLLRKSKANEDEGICQRKSVSKETVNHLLDWSLFFPALLLSVTFQVKDGPLFVSCLVACFFGRHFFHVYLRLKTVKIVPLNVSFDFYFPFNSSALPKVFQPLYDSRPEGQAPTVFLNFNAEPPWDPDPRDNY